MSGLHWFSSYFIRKVFAKDICKSDELLIIISLTPCLTIVIRNRRDTEPECLRISWCLKSCGCSGSMALLDVRKNHSAIAYSCKERKKEEKSDFCWYFLEIAKQILPPSTYQHQQGASCLLSSSRPDSSCSASSWKRSVKEQIKPAALPSYSTSSTLSPGNQTHTDWMINSGRTELIHLFVCLYNCCLSQQVEQLIYF